MKTQTLTRLAQTVLTCSLAVAVGCTFVPQTGQIGPAGQGGFSQQGLSGQAVDYTAAFERLQARRMAEARQKLRNKVPHTGPIAVNLNPDLLRPLEQNGSKSVDLSERLPTGGFRTQSESISLLEETFSKGAGPLELTREFQAPDTSKVYTLLVQSGDVQGQHTVTSAFVNINGHDWVRPNDFSGAVDIRKPSGQRLSQGNQTRDFQKSGILLQAHNSLRLTLNGAPGSTLTLKIVEGGSAGAIRRVNGPMNEHPTQQHHVQSNDTNILDPSRPDSLGDLAALDGDRVEQSPEGEFRVAGVQVNDGQTTQFESGVLILKFREEHGLAAFQQLYDAEVLEQLDDYYRIRLNLDKSPILQMLPLLRAYNAGSPEDITRASFSSLQALKTFVVILDAVQQIPDLLEAIEFNQVAETPFYSEPADWRLDQSDRIKNMPLADDSWWLSRTATNSAWNYSIGTGVKAALLDIGFNGNHPEINRRIILGKFNNQLGPNVNRNNINDPDASYNSSKGEPICKKWHGHCSLMTAFAERDNFHPNGDIRRTVGVAPNAHVIPYVAKTSFNFSHALKEAIKHQPDVIGMNHNFPMNFWSAFWDALVGIYTFSSATHLLSAAMDVMNAQIPLLVAAHNYEDHIKERQPSLLAVEPSLPMMVVGGVSPLEPYDSNKSRSNVYNPYVNFRHYIDKNQAARGSGFGPDLIWAPGDSIDIANWDPSALSTGANPLNDIYEYGGTSAALPFVTGVVALMKSRHPDMTPAQIKAALLASQSVGISVQVDPASEMYKAGFTSVRMLNVKDAVDRAIQQSQGVPPREQDRGSVLHPYYAWYNYQDYWNQSLTFNQNHFASAHAAQKKLTALNTLSEDMMNRAQNKLVKVFGWRGNNIRAGRALSPGFPTHAAAKVLSASDVEILGFEDILEPSDRNNCPTITAINPPSISGPATLSVQGTKLYSPENLPELVLQPLSGGPVKTIPMDLSHADTQLAQNGTQATFIIKAEHLSPDTTGEEYRAAFKGFYCNGTAARGGALNFTPDKKLEVTGGFTLASITEDVLNSGQLNGIPIHAFLGEGQTVDANIGDNALVAVAGDKNNLTVEIGGVQVPVMAVVEDMIAFGIPPQVPVGIQDVIISAAGGSMTLEQAIRILSPIPQPSPTPTPGVQGAPIVVSFPSGAANTRPPVNPGLFSTLVGFMDSFGNSASWVGINNISQPVQLSYPPAPGLPTASDGSIPLKINIQVAQNESQGGTVTVQRGSTSVGVLPAQEGTVHTLTFFSGAHASNGSTIYIQLHGTDPDAQLIYSMQAQSGL